MVLIIPTDGGSWSMSVMPQPHYQLQSAFLLVPAALRGQHTMWCSAAANLCNLCSASCSVGTVSATSISRSDVRRVNWSWPSFYSWNTLWLTSPSVSEMIPAPLVADDDNNSSFFRMSTSQKEPITSLFVVNFLSDVHGYWTSRAFPVSATSRQADELNLSGPHGLACLTRCQTTGSDGKIKADCAKVTSKEPSRTQELG